MKLTAKESIAWIQSRRSIYPKTFDKSEKASKEQIVELLEAARWAPSHKITQPWRFVVFADKGLEELVKFQIEMLQKSNAAPEIVEMKSAKLKLKAEQSSAIIAIIMNRDELKRVPEWEEMCAVACAVQNIALHASSLGLGGYWSTGSFTNHDKMRSYLGLKELDVHLGWYYLGVSKNDREVKRSRLEVEDFAEFRLG